MINRRRSILLRRILPAVVAASIGIYFCSNWWERAYAKHLDSTISPDGCIRIDTYEPFWILPSVFHERPDPDPDIHNGIGDFWEAAIFKRAYEAKTGDFLGETIVFDPTTVANITYWGSTSRVGRRVVAANQFPLTDTDRCADAETLARLEAFYESERESNRKYMR